MTNLPASDEAAAPRPVLLTCPIRGALNASALAKDGLTPTEESRRIEFLKYLLKRGYPAANIAVETVILRKLGEGGRNSLRADVTVYSKALDKLSGASPAERLDEVVLVAEIKRQASKKTSGVDNQLIPAMRVLPSMTVLGVYWDDVNQLLFHKSVIRENGAEHVRIGQDSLANLPQFGQRYKSKPITLSTLVPAENLVSILQSIANVMRSHGVNDEPTRYRETVKLLLARYIDEKEARDKAPQILDLQVFDGTDPDFRSRIDKVYGKAASRYSRAKSLFAPVKISSLKDDALRECVRTVQGIDLSSAPNDVLQQVFMSFVPAVFKRSLDQYFTPITLIDAMVEMTQIGPTDKVADPAMGTADFLSAAMAYRVAKGDDDAYQRVYGIDMDSQAYELAVINMILNRDGQANLLNEDSIEKHAQWAESMNVVLCNPPFGSRTVEKRSATLKNYELGFQWTQGEGGRWVRGDDVVPQQQLGLLFIERCYKLLDEDGRVAIILPEGYLCTPSYGYVRQWIMDHFQVLSLVELPRRIFLKSEADLRSNILIARKKTAVGPPQVPYAIHTELVRKVGYKLGKSFSSIPLRDPSTGLARRDAENNEILDTDFTRVRESYAAFLESTGDGRFIPEGWLGATSDDVYATALLDLKPRRLSVKALANVRGLLAGDHVRLRDVADVLEGDAHLLNLPDDPGALHRLIEGEDIRAVEGTAWPKEPQRAWAIADRKAAKVYKLQQGDIIVGLVRPERRNVGLLFADYDNMVGAPDGIAVIRPHSELSNDYGSGWLFAALRSEAARLQLWTESGGTSYGKLTREQIRETILPSGSPESRAQTEASVQAWQESMKASLSVWESIGAPDDRVPIRNSPLIGLAEDESDIEDD
ncbi:N-6 DNA methylase [Frigoribacterium sp. CFBP 8759]|uniref:N-6 DNA methylase n=1 Tax=Frigoribacterium sp. CFBP 8759 TaxID=2775283 RepID=UPI00177FF767|nr:N-6 DNA methylase [Frigoribacterium sp. CFBP 8759]MBD8485029.1 N-6 DNA methylase [Frigoribacterium sp. CFBP 8759]